MHNTTASASTMPERGRGMLAGLKLAAFNVEFWRGVVLVVSGWTTMRGMFQVYGMHQAGQGSGSMAELAWMIPVALAGGLHVAIYTLLTRGAEHRRIRFYAAAAMFQLLAVLASFGSHWTHMFGASNAVAGYEQIHDEIIRGLRKSHASYAAIGTAAGALAAHSIAMAGNEATGAGDSCGATAGRGEGPRHALRLQDRDMFTDLDAQVAERLRVFDELLAKAEKLVAGSVAEAHSRRDELRRVVNQAKPFEADVLLGQIRRTAGERIAKGRGPIDIEPALRGKSGAPTFTCPDPTLERHLMSVVAAIDALQPLPEADFIDTSDPRNGTRVALQRLFGFLLGLQPPALGREAEHEARVLALHGGANQSEQLTGEDVSALSFAFAVEALLTILFLIGNPKLPHHPGSEFLAKLLRRRNQRHFDSVWMALGGTAERGAVLRILPRYTKFEGKRALVFVPTYAVDEEAQTLHRFMLILSHAGFAKLLYTGDLRARLNAARWTREHRARVLGNGAVRVFRLSALDWFALLLDQLEANEDAPESVGTVTSLLPRPPVDGQREAA